MEVKCIYGEYGVMCDLFCYVGDLRVSKIQFETLVPTIGYCRNFIRIQPSDPTIGFGQMLGIPSDLIGSNTSSKRCGPVHFDTYLLHHSSK